MLRINSMSIVTHITNQQPSYSMNRLLGIAWRCVDNFNSILSIFLFFTNSLSYVFGHNSVWMSSWKISDRSVLNVTIQFFAFNREATNSSNSHPTISDVHKKRESSEQTVLFFEAWGKWSRRYDYNAPMLPNHIEVDVTKWLKRKSCRYRRRIQPSLCGSISSTSLHGNFRYTKRNECFVHHLSVGRAHWHDKSLNCTVHALWYSFISLSRWLILIAHTQNECIHKFCVGSSDRVEIAKCKW